METCWRKAQATTRKQPFCHIETLVSFIFDTWMGKSN